VMNFCALLLLTYTCYLICHDGISNGGRLLDFE